MKIYNTRQAAEFLDIKVQMVRHYIRNGKLKAKLVGRDYIITEANLRAFKKTR